MPFYNTYILYEDIFIVIAWAAWWCTGGGGGADRNTGSVSTCCLVVLRGPPGRKHLNTFNLNQLLESSQSPKSPQWYILLSLFTRMCQTLQTCCVLGYKCNDQLKPHEEDEDERWNLQHKETTRQFIFIPVECLFDSSDSRPHWGSMTTTSSV